MEFDTSNLTRASKVFPNGVIIKIDEYLVTNAMIGCFVNIFTLTNILTGETITREYSFEELPNPVWSTKIIDVSIHSSEDVSDDNFIYGMTFSDTGILLTVTTNNNTPVLFVQHCPLDTMAEADPHTVHVDYSKINYNELRTELRAELNADTCKFLQKYIEIEAMPSITDNGYTADTNCCVAAKIMLQELYHAAREFDWDTIKPGVMMFGKHTDMSKSSAVGVVMYIMDEMFNTHVN